MKKLFYSDKPLAGLDISSTGLKVMALDPIRWLVFGYGSLDLDPVKIKDSLEGDDDYLGQNIKSLLKNNIVGAINTDHVAMSLPASRSFSRTFNLPVKAEKHLKDAVDLEVDQYIPIPSNQLYIDYEIIKKTKDEITVLVSAIPRKITDQAVKSAEDAGLIVSLVEPSTNSISRLLAKIEDGNIPTIIVDIGPASTDIAITDNGTVRVTNSLQIGGNTFTLEIARKMALTLEDAHQLKVLNGLNAGSKQEKIKLALDASLKQIVNETRKVIRYFNERISGGQKLEQLLIVGSGSNLPGIGEYFTNEIVMPARVASPWQKLDFGKLPEPAQQYRPRYMTVAGLALATNKKVKND